jgi:hypothetical protein
MNSKEKAQDLVNKFGSKEKAMLCIEEILQDNNESLSVAKELGGFQKGLIVGTIAAWLEVKKELNSIEWFEESGEIPESFWKRK